MKYEHILNLIEIISEKYPTAPPFFFCQPIKYWQINQKLIKMWRIVSGVRGGEGSVNFRSNSHTFLHFHISTLAFRIETKNHTQIIVKNSRYSYLYEAHEWQ